MTHEMSEMLRLAAGKYTREAVEIKKKLLMTFSPSPDMMKELRRLAETLR